jgi:adenylylsulfate kinase-like enzyme
MTNLNGKVIWLIALPNGGKTAIGNALKERISDYYNFTIIIDGDDLRKALEMTQSGYSLESRIKNGYRVGRLAKMFADQGACVIVAANTLIYEVQQWNRENLDYIEVFIETDEATRRKRDFEKKLYHKYDLGEIENILGVDIKAEIPKSPDIIISNDLNSNISDHIDEIVSYLEKK